jgi:hypothetical protein
MFQIVHVTIHFGTKKFGGEARASLVLPPYYHYRAPGLLAHYFQCWSWPTDCIVSASKKGGTTYRVIGIYKNSTG